MKETINIRLNDNFNRDIGLRPAAADRPSSTISEKNSLLENIPYTYRIWPVQSSINQFKEGWWFCTSKFKRRVFGSPRCHYEHSFRSRGLNNRIIYFYYLFFHRRPNHKFCFLSCRSFVANATFSTGLIVSSGQARRQKKLQNLLKMSRSRRKANRKENTTYEWDDGEKIIKINNLTEIFPSVHETWYLKVLKQEDQNILSVDICK